MRNLIAISSFAACCCAFGGIYNVRTSQAPDRVKTPLKVDLKRLGTLRPRSAADIKSSNWTLGCEVLDRDFANFDEYKEHLAPLGIKTIRLQGGWAKCEKVKGVYDFAWLDHLVDYAVAQGLNVLLETDYGNPIYKGGGGWDLGAGFPTSEEGLAGWDAWVDALSKHFKGRVRDWAMWNEPDCGGKTPEMVAAFNVRTAKIIRRNIPDARLAGLSLASNNPPYLEAALKAMGEDVKLFDWFIYHGYSPAPESSYEKVEIQKEIVARYNPNAKMRQGENGCPSEMAQCFALSAIPWSEYSQAKWDMRRMLGDLGHDVESSVFTICDFNHKGREINVKGLLRADEARNVIAVKRAYYAVQNVVSVFDDTLSRVKDSTWGKGFGTRDLSLATYHYVKNSGEPVFVFWSCVGELARYRPTQAEALNKKALAKNPQAKLVKAGVNILSYVRPGDSFETRPGVFKYTGSPLKAPVWVDLFTGGVYEIPSENVIVTPEGVRFINIPVYDSPCLITEKSALDFATL